MQVKSLNQTINLLPSTFEILRFWKILQCSEIRYIFKNYMHLSYCFLSVFSCLWCSRTGQVCVIAFSTDKVLCMPFQGIYISPSRKLMACNLEKNKVWVSLFLNLIISYWWFLVNLVMPNVFKFAFIVTQP